VLVAIIFVLFSKRKHLTVAESDHDDHELHGKDKNCIWSRERLHRQATIQVVFGKFS